MKEFLSYNYILCVPITAWFAAQFSKVIFSVITTRAFNPERILGSGGMPSVHTAMVVALSIAVARDQGTRSPLFGAVCVIAFIVMYDALNVRRQAGEHAKTLNVLSKLISQILKDSGEKNSSLERDNTDILYLKELLGHTPVEVFVGILYGIGIAMLFPKP